MIRTQLVTVAGAGISYPMACARCRSIFDLSALQSKGARPNDVVTTITAQNLILPSGTAKIAPSSTRSVTSSPVKVEELNDLPVRAVNAVVSASATWPTCGTGSLPDEHARRWPASLLSVIKMAILTLDIVKGIRALSSTCASSPAAAA